MRLVTIGIGVSGAEQIVRDTPLRLRAGDVVIIDGEGNRFHYAPTADGRTLAGVLPSIGQQAEIRSFVEDEAGTIITIAADPKDVPLVPFYREYVPSDWPCLTYPVEFCGGLAEIRVPTYDWIPVSLWPLLQDAYAIFASEEIHHLGRWEQCGQLQLITRAVTQVVCLQWGRGTLAVCRSRVLLKQPDLVRALLGPTQLLAVSA